MYDPDSTRKRRRQTNLPLGPIKRYMFSLDFAGARLLHRIGYSLQQTLASVQRDGITRAVLKKANLLKGRDAKLPVYGCNLRQRGCQKTAKDMLYVFAADSIGKPRKSHPTSKAAQLT